MSHTTTRVAPGKRRAAGASLVTAIFLLVVIAGLGAAMLNLATGQHASSAMDVRGARAYQAARAGIEWGVFQQLQLDNCAATTTFVPPAPTLNMFSVTVRCTPTPTPAAGLGATPAAMNGTLVANSADVTAIADTAILLEGMRVWGPGIVPGTRIASITGATTLTLSVPALAGGAGPLSFRSSMDRWRIRSIACTQPTAAGVCPNPAPISPDYVQREVQAEI